VNPLTPTEAVKAYRSAGVQAREAMIALTAARIAYADAETNYRACAFARDQAIADCRAALDPRGLPACA
jgi:hypothetical protein